MVGRAEDQVQDSVVRLAELQRSLNSQVGKSPVPKSGPTQGRRGLLRHGWGTREPRTLRFSWALSDHRSNPSLLLENRAPPLSPGHIWGQYRNLKWCRCLGRKCVPSSGSAYTTPPDHLPDNERQVSAWSDWQRAGSPTGTWLTYTTSNWERTAGYGSWGC